MGYLFLSLSLFAGSVKGYCGKRISNRTEGFRDAMLTNVIRMSLCMVIGLLIIILSGNPGKILPDGATLATSVLSGVSTAVFVVSWLLSVKNGAYMLVEVFIMLGVLVPIVSGIYIFHTPVRLNQWIGLLILVAATLIMCSYNSSIKGTINLKTVLLLTVSGLSSGLTDLSQKLFVEYSENNITSVFNFYTYIFAGIVLLIFFSACSKKTEARKTAIKNTRSIMGYIFIMAIALFANSFFKTKAAGFLAPAQLYPLSQGAALMLSTLMAAFFFKERLTVKAVIGIVMSFAGIIIINVL